MHARSRTASQLLRALLLIPLVLLSVARAEADTNALPATNFAADVEGRNAEAVVIGTQENLRSSLQIQEELHNTQLAIEKNRKEAEAEAARQNEILEGRLKLIEQSIASQRLDELKDLQRSNRLILFAAGAFAVVGFVVLLFAAFVQWTAVNRLNVLSSRLPQALGRGTTPAALGMGEAAMLPAAGEQPTVQLLGVIEKLERRIDSIEKGAPRSVAADEHLSSETESAANGAAESNGEEKSPAGEPAGAVALLMGKGQTLLKLDKPEEAIACFDEALAKDPGNTDVLVRKGAALERLQRMDEAIACYDLAIAADSSMTMAYLYKGGVYNRMERYSEALECYEQALKTQQKGHAANVIIEN
jgi:tetratricopeptide (TPR) repeat protein